MQVMTEEHLKQYDELHRQRQANEITPDEFIEKAREIPGSLWHEVDRFIEVLRHEREIIERRLHQE